MPAQLAALLTYSFVFWLFLRDIREKPNITKALWLPFVWFFFVATRNPSQWMTLLGIPGFASGGATEGSSLDASLYLFLILWGLRVLMGRGVALGRMAQENIWITVFLLYCLVSSAWADYPFVSVKRWIKMLGHPVMALVIMTEPDPRESLKRLMIRSTYVLVPISIMLIKYFPAIGRSGGGWVSELSNRGITTGKNLFGANCWVIATFLLWYILQAWPKPKGPERKKELANLFLLFGMNLWCFWKSNSATSWNAFIVAAVTMLFLRKPALRDRWVGLYFTAAVLVVAVLEVGFDASARINAWRGKHDTVEGRGELWAILLDMDTNPVVGTGYESFWIGERWDTILAMPEFAHWKPNEAHNGYLELYLTLGVIGLGLATVVLWQIYRHGKFELAFDREMGRFRLACLFAILAYNWMEAAFRGLSVVFFLFFLLGIKYRTAPEAVPEGAGRRRTLRPGEIGEVPGTAT